MLEIIGAVLKIAGLLLGKWFKLKDEQKEKAKKILKGVPNAKTPESITRIFNRINRL